MNGENKGHSYGNNRLHFRNNNEVPRGRHNARRRHRNDES